MTKPQNRTTKELPLNIVGSSIFGRYPEISVEHFQHDHFR